MTALTGTIDPVLDRFAARDGTSIFTRHWPAVGTPWASALIVHGLAEHSGRYEHVGSHFAENGIDAWALDLRGFGQSGGERAWVDRWSHFHDDMEERVTSIRTAAPGLPLILYGHSLGGLLVLGYALEARSMPDALVLSAPAMAATLPFAQRLAVNVLGRLVPHFRVPNALDTSTLSSIPAVQADYVSDPLNVHTSCVGFGLKAFGEQDRVVKALDRIPVPTLVIHGGLDRLVPTESSAVLEGHPHVTRRVYEGVWHELHNEPAADRVLDDVVTWIRGAVAAT